MPKPVLSPARRRRFLLALPAMCGALAVAAPVASASGDEVLRDCAAGALKPHYAQSDYRDALENMPADAAEYSDCRARISAARLRELREGDGIVVSGRKTDVPRSAAGTAAGASVESPTETNDFEGEPDGQGAAAEGGTPAQAAESESSIAPSGESVAFTPISAAGDGVLSSGQQHRAPMVPVAIAFSAIVLGLTRVLIRWGRRDETIAG